MSQGSPSARRRGEAPGGEDRQLWEAVTEPSRRRVLDLILVHGEATPTTLAAELPFTRQAVTKHLGVLSRAGVVEARRHGREVRYSVCPERLGAAARAMAQVAARWDTRLEAIKRLAGDGGNRAAAPPVSGSSGG